MTVTRKVNIDGALERADLTGTALETAAAPPKPDQRFMDRLHTEAPGQWVRFPRPTPMTSTLVKALAGRFRKLGCATEVTRRGRGWDLWLKAE